GVASVGAYGAGGSVDHRQADRIDLGDQRVADLEGLVRRLQHHAGRTDDLLGVVRFEIHAKVVRRGLDVELSAEDDVDGDRSVAGYRQRQVESVDYSRHIVDGHVLRSTVDHLGAGGDDAGRRVDAQLRDGFADVD